jgi:2-oxoglutarate ferredoxin oxidoreductase subunit gamma
LNGIKDSLPARHHHLIPVNEDAIKRGMEIVKEL